MKFSRSKFLATVFFQLIFIFLDIAFNVISDKLLVRKENYTLLLLYVLQDACILMSLTLISLSLFRTNVFKIPQPSCTDSSSLKRKQMLERLCVCSSKMSGFMVLLLKRFKLTLIFSILYILITIALQTDILLTRWNNLYDWKNGIGILYFLQRSVAVFYYYFTKRTALRLSDPRFYDEEWVKHTIAHDMTGK